MKVAAVIPQLCTSVVKTSEQLALWVVQQQLQCSVTDMSDMFHITESKKEKKKTCENIFTLGGGGDRNL